MQLKTGLLPSLAVLAPVAGHVGHQFDPLGLEGQVGTAAGADCARLAGRDLKCDWF